MDRGWISIVAGVGGFSVSLLSIYLGYLLFLAGATGQFEINAQVVTGKLVVLNMSSSSPGYSGNPASRSAPPRTSARAGAQFTPANWRLNRKAG